MERIDEHLHVACERNAPGVAAGLLLPDGTRKTDARGAADVERATPMTPDTPTRIGSITKTFTSAAVLLLAERGALGLDDPAVEHLPELRALQTEGHRLDAVTVRRLLLHRAGLVGEPPTRDWHASPFPATEEVLERIDLARVAIAPGSAFKYSNLGYALLGAIVARAAGVRYERFVQETLLAPAGLTATTFEQPADAAVGHGRGPDWRPQLVQELAAERPGGGMWSTVPDLLRWAEVMLGRVPGVLSPELVALLLRPETADDATLSSGRSLGWMVTRSGERVLHGHTGAVLGYCARLAFDVAGGTAATVLANTHAFPGDPAAELLGAPATPLEPDPEPTPASPDPVGDYGGPNDGVARVERRDGALWLTGALTMLPHGTPLDPLEGDRLMPRSGRFAGEPLAFERASDGAVAGFEVAGWRYVRG